jgi:nitroreductase
MCNFDVTNSFAKMENLKYITEFKNRRSVRSFSKREVSTEQLNTLLEAASHAPTTGNMQLYSVVVTRDEQIKQRLAPAHFSQPASVNAPIMLTFCADHNRFEKWCRQRNAVPGYNNFQSFTTAVLDVTIFAQQFCILAELNGLGCCYLGTTTYNPQTIAEVLNLPNRVVPILTIALGWPEGETFTSDRLPLTAIVHNDTYTDYTPDAIDKAFAEKEALDSTNKFIAENGKQTLAQVFTDVRYTKKDAEYFSDCLENFIKRQGY